ncbi:MAG: cation:proton antiporter [Euryarchaeota archaeon]|nr:cation:proton antiporter [Euryarchaeota archaeon]MDE1835236.1 cation:proton antiporter [Euryarchaeota archaeon]MDE1881039.1 cation:proton antiporter [Euryarchaeota archaeon]MDE2043532.1 cation:proton antiporter [Thermoplasmata archaeon]
MDERGAVREPPVDFLTALFLVLGSAVIAGEVAARLGHVALVGQVAVGVVLGPTLLGGSLGLTMNPSTTVGAGLGAIQTVAVFFILFMAGLEVVPEDIWSTGAVSATLGLSMFLIPFFVGAWFLPFVFPTEPLTTDLFISLTLSITALPVMAVILIELKMLKTRLGSMVLGAAVVNELSAMTTFALLLHYHGSSTTLAGLLVPGLEVAVFISTVLTIHQVLKLLRQGPAWARLQQRWARPLRKRQVWFALLMVMALSSSLLSQALGLTFLVGAFYAGLLVTRESAGPVARREIGRVFGTMTWGFFIPLFFALVGLDMDLRQIFTLPMELTFAAMFVFACSSKIVVGAAVPLAFGWTPRQAATVASLVNGRGAVELAIATILLNSGVFTLPIFTLVASVGLVTTIIAPLGAALAWRKEVPSAAAGPPTSGRAPAPAK